MVDQLVAAGVLGVVFLAAVYAHYQRLGEVGEPFWHLAGGSIGALVVVYAVGEALVAPQPVAGVVSISGGAIVLGALTVPLAVAAFARPNVTAG
jgi:hypothetical protein